MAQPSGPAAGGAVLGLAIHRRPRRVALAGNPNVGKSSLYNALTGLRQKVTNYPGTTVEKIVGRLSWAGSVAELVDLPGTYSLLPRSPDEAVARDEILGRIPGESPPDVVVVVVDASNLERNLFLATQVIESGRSVVIALNQVDLALERGVCVDADALSRALHVPVVVTSGRTGQGRDALADAIMKGGGRGRPLDLELPPEVVAAARELAPDLGAAVGSGPRAAAALAEILCSEAAAQDLVDRLQGSGAHDLAERVWAQRTRLGAAGIDVATAAANARYAAIDRLMANVVTRSGESGGWRWRLDRALLHPVTGSVVLVAILGVIFAAVFSWSGYLMDAVGSGVEWIGSNAAEVAGGGLLGEFVENGLGAGCGAFLVFVPQIAILFLLLETLDDTGYLARATFLLDRVMGKAGLPGRAFVPLLSGFACAIPGIMATRTISNVRDRMVTMAVLPLMQCQARLPVYLVILGALFSAYAWWVGTLVVVSMYVLGIAVALLFAGVLRRTILRGGRTPLMLELPPYRLPKVAGVVRNTSRRTWTFIAGAGPIILVLTMVLWALATFPREGVTESAAVEASAADTSGGTSQLAHSYLGRAGRWMEPAIAPLGFDWKMGVGIVASFAAREMFVPTLGVIYAVGEDADEESEGLRQSIRDDRRPDGSRVFTPLVGVSLLVFYALALQCMSTVAILKRETNSWRWPVGLFLTFLAVAYLASLVTYQVGTALGF